MVYYSQGRRRDAARIWQKGLIASRYAYCPFEFGTADHYNQYSLAKPNIAFQLSELFNDSPDSVYKYTLWADTVFCPPFTWQCLGGLSCKNITEGRTGIPGQRGYDKSIGSSEHVLTTHCGSGRKAQTIAAFTI